MKKLYFINLAIDHLWDDLGQLKTLFSTRLPESEKLLRSYEDLAKYLIKDDDSALISAASVEEKMPLGHHLIKVSANPFDVDEWLAEVSKRVSKETEFELWPASISKLELGLLELFPKMKLATWLPRNFPAAELNRKSRIFDWSDITNLPVPKTELLTTTQLNSSPTKTIDHPYYLKYDWGSGGGANFLVKESNDLHLRVLQRQLAGISDGIWIKQEFIPQALNLSVFGWASGSSLEIMTIDYDDRGLSYLHQPSFKKYQKINMAFVNMADHLRTHYNYQGPFGLDIVQDSSGEFHLIDVNIRWTKSHLISTAAQRFGFKNNNWQSIRLRSAQPMNLSQLPDGAVPYHLGDPSFDGASAREICYFKPST